MDTSSNQMSLTECLKDTNGNSQASAEPLHLSVTEETPKLMLREDQFPGKHSHAVQSVNVK